jgi:hypothetical protein
MGNSRSQRKFKQERRAILGKSVLDLGDELRLEQLTRLLRKPTEEAKKRLWVEALNMLEPGNGEALLQQLEGDIRNYNGGTL